MFHRGSFAIVSRARLSWLPPLIIGLFVSELLRWWSRRRKERSSAPAPSISAKEIPPTARKPPRRPGVDDDVRFQKLQDDPRYFPGAQLGKAQRAALGEVMQFEGPNTASYSPSSTLVEPSIRFIVAGSGSKCFTGAAGPDDIIAVPDFFCAATQMDLYDSMLAELREMVEGDGDGSEFPHYHEIMAQIKEFFAVGKCSTCITWHETLGNPSLSAKSDNFDEVMTSGDFECAVHFVLGGSYELQLHRPGPVRDGFLAVPCVNGSLCLLGSATLARYCCRRIVTEDQPRPALSIIMLTSSAALRRSRAAILKPREISPLLEEWDSVMRPAMRIRALRPNAELGRISHDDVIVIPEFACKMGDWDAYYALLREIRAGQESDGVESKWESWHEGAHLLTQTPNNSETFQEILGQLCHRFAIRQNGYIGTRFNWYRDSSDWKPFHHDSAAFNRERALKQNCTVGVSFGASRELAFQHVKSRDLLYFPQTNGMLFFFGRDVNIRWRHGINALPPEQQSSKGRISIISWGLCELAFEEPCAPPMLDDLYADRKGKGKSKGKGTKEWSLFEGKGKSKGKGGEMREVCRMFQRGQCSRGDSCKYSHVLRTA